MDLLAVTGVVCRVNAQAIPAGGIVSLRFNLFGRDHGHFVTCNRLFRVAVRLRGSRPPTNCTWVSFRYRKGSEDLYAGLWCLPFARNLPNAWLCPRKLAGSDDVISNNRFSLGKSPSCARWRWNELLIFLQSALIRLLGNPGRSANNAQRHDEIPEFSCVFPSRRRCGRPGELGLCLPSREAASAAFVRRSIQVDEDQFRLPAAILGWQPRRSSPRPPAGARRRDAIRRRLSVFFALTGTSKGND